MSAQTLGDARAGHRQDFERYGIPNSPIVASGWGFEPVFISNRRSFLLTPR